MDKIRQEYSNLENSSPLKHTSFIKFAKSILGDDLYNKFISFVFKVGKKAIWEKSFSSVPLFPTASKHSSFSFVKNYCNSSRFGILFLVFLSPCWW